MLPGNQKGGGGEEAAQILSIYYSLVVMKHIHVLVLHSDYIAGLIETENCTFFSKSLKMQLVLYVF